MHDRYGPRLQTERLDLRLWRADEAPRVMDLLGRREVVQWLSDDFDHPELVTDLGRAREKIASWEQRTGPDPMLILAIVPRATGIPAGSVILQPLPRAEHGEVEIGWHLHPDSHGNGYATEAARAVLAHGFGCGLEEIWAVMYPHNAPSRAVAERLGMEEVEVAERWYPGLSRIFRIQAP